MLFICFIQRIVLLGVRLDLQQKKRLLCDFCFEAAFYLKNK